MGCHRLYAVDWYLALSERQPQKTAKMRIHSVMLLFQCRYTQLAEISKKYHLPRSELPYCRA